MMKNHCAPFVTKNKAKTPEDEKNYKSAEKVFEMLKVEINSLFDSISKKDGKPVFGVIDKTIEVEDIVRFFKKIDLLWNETPPIKEKPTEPEEKPIEGEGDEGEGEKDQDLNDTSKSKQDKSKSKTQEEEEDKKEGEGEAEEEIKETTVEEESFKCPTDKISLLELISIIEKYYNPNKTLRSMIHSKIDAEDYNHEYNIHKLTNRYYMHIKGSELIQFEFQEILLEISILLKNKVEEPSGKPKVRSTLKKFIEETLLKRWGAFSDYPKIVKSIHSSGQWPDSYKDQLIKERKEAERIRLEKEKKRKEEEAKEAKELELMRDEDTPALSAEQIEELKKQQELEEKLRKEQEEGDALDEEDEDELDDEEDIDDEDDADDE